MNFIVTLPVTSLCGNGVYSGGGAEGEDWFCNKGARSSFASSAILGCCDSHVII